MKMLEGESTISKHPNASTLYLCIPSKMAGDSQFGLKEGDKVKLQYKPQIEMLVITRKSSGEKK